jgi:pimeloyl-ACP methyl ester carboxylesterase
MPFAERGSRLRIYYETFGRRDAPPLLLIMGMGFSSRAWSGLPEQLSERFRVITYDNRGAGKTEGAGAVFRVRDMADDALAVLDAAGAGRAGVFGISMGGMVALELTLRHPERVRALALGATFAGWLGSRKPAPSVVGDLVVGGLLSRLGSHRLLGHALVSRERLEDGYPFFSSWIAQGERVLPHVLLQQMTAVTLHATESRLPGIEVPTLVMTGDADRLVPEENSRRIAALIPGARYVVLPGAGHCFPLEQPEATLAELLRFFGEDFPAGEREAVAGDAGVAAGAGEAGSPEGD